MGRVVNPGNVGFANMPTSRYVYKTGLIGEFDPTLGSNRRLVPSTRPRRFGKSHAALSLAAFHSCVCESRRLFDGLEISKLPGFYARPNAYNVVLQDITATIEGAKQKGEGPTNGRRHDTLQPGIVTGPGRADCHGMDRGGVTRDRSRRRCPRQWKRCRTHQRNPRCGRCHGEKVRLRD